MTSAATETMMAGEVVLDEGVYPRVTVSEMHVRELVDALEAGAVFPPIVVEQTTNRLVDGAHRTRAILRARGPEGKIACEHRQYDSEVEMLLAAVEANSAHGLNLSHYDRQLVIQKAAEMSVDIDRLAAALHIPQDRLGVLQARHATENGERLALKGGLQHLNGKELSKRQVSAMQRASGMNVTFHANQILLAMDGDLINRESEAVIGRLANLRDRLMEFLR